MKFIATSMEAKMQMDERDPEKARRIWQTDTLKGSEFGSHECLQLHIKSPSKTISSEDIFLQTQRVSDVPHYHKLSCIGSRGGHYVPTVATIRVFRVLSPETRTLSQATEQWEEMELLIFDTDAAQPEDKGLPSARATRHHQPGGPARAPSF